jgi:SPP1 gp7 family putative phage head morphogenesis protein
MWGAHKADGRIAAKNSVKIRAALRQSIDAKEVFEEYSRTQPNVSDNITQDRARARAWAMLNVRVNTEPITAALRAIYADGYVLGEASAQEAVARARKAQDKALSKSDDAYIDWSKWTPGNKATALLLRPRGAFKKFLDDAGVVSKAIEKAGYDRIGTALADSIAAGFSPARAAKVITEKIGDPARALTIAITEQNRAMSAATLLTYQEAQVEQIEWNAVEPCDICAPNDGQVVNLGEAFDSGDTQPPAHPNCRCALLPVIMGMVDDRSLGQDFLDTLGGASLESEGYPTELTISEAAALIKDLPKPSEQGDPKLGALQEAMGFNRLPELVTEEELESRKAKGWIGVYRGVRDLNAKDFLAPQLVEQFKTGSHYPGIGIYGNGTYTTTNIVTAGNYAEGRTANLMTMAIDPTAKIIDYEKASELMLDALQKRENEVGWREIKVQPEYDLFKDVGKFAVTMGYDAISVERGGTSATGGNKEIYYVILNRTKVAVVK